MKAAALSSLGIGHCTQDQWTQKNITYFLEWSPPWQLFWHTTWKYIRHIYSGILPGIYSDILSGILFGINSLTHFLACMPSGILPGIYSAILFGILFGILFLHSIWHLFWHSFLPLYPTFYSGILFGIYSDILSDMGTPGRQLRAPDLIFPSMSLNLCPKPGLRQRGASVSRSRRTVDEYVIVLMLTDKPPCVQNKMANNF